MFFPFDYFKIGGQSRESVMCNVENVYFKWACYISQFIKKSTSSNLIDIYFIIRIVLAMKSQADSITNLVTPQVLLKRKRLVLSE